MKTIKLKINEIKPYEKNARKNDKAVDAIVQSIKECGYIAPIIIDENNVILAGHTRHKALKKLNYEEVECVVIAGLTEEQKKKYRILDNKTNELADWDFDILAEEIKDLDFSNFDFDLLGQTLVDNTVDLKETEFKEDKQKKIECPFCGKEINL